MPGFHIAEASRLATMAAISTRLTRPRIRTGFKGPVSAGRRLAPETPDVDGDEDDEQQSGNDRRLQPDVPRGPEEVDAVQEADEQRGIAERAQRAADIGDQDDEEDDDMSVAAPRPVGPDQGADQDHRRPGGADDARHQRAEREDAGIRRRRAPDVARDENAAGHDIEREQQHDEAEIFGEHGVDECGQRRHASCEPDQRAECQQ
ncbi:hypothetical protein BRDID11002_51980 [Bradyrhizobium diazoefficiens]